jgi:hypothetical protein
MTLELWIAVAGIVSAAVLAISGGLIGWMVSVAGNLSSISANTSHLADRIDSVDETTKNIVCTLGEHSERIEDLGLKVNTLQTQFSLHDRGAKAAREMGS